MGAVAVATVAVAMAMCVQAGVMWSNLETARQTVHVWGVTGAVAEKLLLAVVRAPCRA